jgi:hypothetical protein
MSPLAVRVRPFLAIRGTIEFYGADDDGPNGSSSSNPPAATHAECVSGEADHISLSLSK